jgi:hypothetical protein
MSIQRPARANRDPMAMNAIWAGPMGTTAPAQRMTRAALETQVMPCWSMAAV